MIRMFSRIGETADTGKSTTFQMIDRVLQICSILHDFKEHSLDRFAWFLMEIEEKRFGKGSQLAIGSLVGGSEANKNCEEALDKFFTAALNLDYRSDDDMLHVVSS